MKNIGGASSKRWAESAPPHVEIELNCLPKMMKWLLFALLFSKWPTKKIKDWIHGERRVEKVGFSSKYSCLISLKKFFFVWKYYYNKAIKSSFQIHIPRQLLLSQLLQVKFIYSENATKFCEIFPLLLSYVVPLKSKVEILQNFVAFPEYSQFIAPEIFIQLPLVM